MRDSTVPTITEMISADSIMLVKGRPICEPRTAKLNPINTPAALPMSVLHTFLVMMSPIFSIAKKINAIKKIKQAERIPIISYEQAIYCLEV